MVGSYYCCRERGLRTWLSGWTLLLSAICGEARRRLVIDLLCGWCVRELWSYHTRTVVVVVPAVSSNVYTAFPCMCSAGLRRVGACTAMGDTCVKSGKMLVLGQVHLSRRVVSLLKSTNSSCIPHSTLSDKLVDYSRHTACWLQISSLDPRHHCQ